MSLPLSVLGPTQANADTGFPVEITFLGPDPVQIEVSAGLVAPCDSSPMIYRGPLLPGTAMSFSSPVPHVCVRHTSAAFPESGWSLSRFHYSPVKCAGSGRRKRCWPDPGQTLRITLRSTDS